MIYFVRHGQSQANADNVFSGPESQLTEKGRLQAKEAGEKLKSDGVIIDRIISSTYGRAVETTKIIADVIGLKPEQIQYDYRLVEFNAGELTNKPEQKISSQLLMNTPGAEDFNVLYKRVLAALNDIKNLPGNTLIVSHAGVGRTIDIILSNKTSDMIFDIQARPNAQIIALG